MNTTTIIIAVAASLFVLVAVVFTLQQIEKSNREKQSLVAALKSRLRSFQHLLDGFPEGFLSRDLKQLVCHCLIDTLDQLARLQPAEYKSALQAMQERMAQLKSLPEQNSYQPLTEAAQIQEVQKLLTSLGNVVQKLVQNRRLQPAQANQYILQVRRLGTRVALDSHIAQAQGALQLNKPRLAEHHYRQAVEKMHKDNADGFYAAQIVNCQHHIAELEQRQQETAAEPVADDAWKAFDEKEDAFQKKRSLYDE